MNANLLPDLGFSDRPGYARACYAVLCVRDARPAGGPSCMRVHSFKTTERLVFFSIGKQYTQVSLMCMLG
jgi:hypothetical protein